MPFPNLEEKHAGRLYVTARRLLHGEQWEPHFGSPDVTQGLWTLFEAAEACLSSLPVQAGDEQPDHTARVVARVGVAARA